ncbi:unnamed protein product [Didymodactylos carnosus]|uniref:SWIM-type domain-containing protein n=1 Tax=Didymodactylos carnosus TaxID=1234261 RepID=A0A814BB72_9BILA|nr:unnamed protein product [Didymodactylos carnosus]CAF3704679.1 unnamed protein product [Didymodactylos carnosus]
MSWYRKDNPDVIPGNPERIGKWDPLQYLDLTKYLKPFNEYPKDFNPRVHGAYLPYMYYGKRQFVTFLLFDSSASFCFLLVIVDTSFSQLKLKEIPEWFARRNKTPSGAYQLGIRAFWRWHRAYGDCKKPNLIWVIQPFILFSLINFFTIAIPERKRKASIALRLLESNCISFYMNILKEVEKSLLYDVETTYTEKKCISDQTMLALFSFYGNQFKHALDLIDTHCIHLYQSKTNNRLYQIHDQNKTLICSLTSSNFCTCSLYRHNVLEKHEYFACKHNIAVKLIEKINNANIEIFEVSDEDINKKLIELIELNQH